MNAARIPNARVDQIIDALNTYEGDNIWQDVILGLPEYDADATGPVKTTTVVLTDATYLNDGSYLDSPGAWCVVPGTRRYA